MQKYRVLRGFDVRIGPDQFRRVAEAGDIITAADCPEWNGEAPPEEIEAGVVELVTEKTMSSKFAAELAKEAWPELDEDQIQTAAMPILDDAGGDELVDGK